MLATTPTTPQIECANAAGQVVRLLTFKRELAEAALTQALGVGTVDDLKAARAAAEAAGVMVGLGCHARGTVAARAARLVERIRAALTP